MYFDFTVPIPTVKGKMIRKKKGSAVYVLFQYGQEYNSEKKYSIPKRTIVGKVSDDDVDTMYPNEKFQEYFPDVALPDELPDAYRSCALRLGAYSVIKKVIDEYKLRPMLSKRFGDDTGLLLDLVAYMIIEEQNAGQYYPDFAFCHPLFSEGMKIFSDSKVSRFLNTATKDQIIGFLDDWNRKRDRKQRIYISYDSSNKNCHAGDIDLIEYGKAKDDKGLPIFNLAIAFEQTNRIPLFYEDYPGSITDVSQFVQTIDKVTAYGYKNAGFILDRGYFSKDNIRYMENQGYAFIIMVKGCKELVSSLVLENRNTFETERKHVIRAYRVYGKTVTSKLYEDDKKERFFHIYFNPSKQAAEREQFETNLDRFKLYMDKNLGQEVALGKIYRNYFNLRFDKQGRLLSYTEKEDVIQRELQLCGYFCIITSENMDASKALIHYKGRDVSEKLFSADKSFLGSKSMRICSNEAMETKLFIEFIALIVRNRIYNLLKETMLKLDKQPNYMTVPAAIRELEKIELVRRNNGRYKLDHAVSNRQKIILSSFGMDADDIKSIAAETADLLANNRSFMDADEEPDEEDI